MHFRLDLLPPRRGIFAGTDSPNESRYIAGGYLTWIIKKEAIKIVLAKFPQLNEKVVTNWAIVGKECPPTKVGNRWGFDSEAFDKWMIRIASGLVLLTKDDYMKCLDYSIEAFYTISRADFGGGKKRDAGQALTDHTSGKLGEIAVQRLLERCELDINLDFNVTGEVKSQDIEGVCERHGKKVWNLPKANTSIKSTKLKNVLLAVDERQVTLEDRRSDLYILSQVGLFDDHILGLLKELDAPIIRKYKEKIKDLDHMPARVAGWTSIEELTAKPLLTKEQIKIEYEVGMAGSNYVMVTGELSTNWDSLKQRLLKAAPAGNP